MIIDGTLYSDRVIIQDGGFLIALGPTCLHISVSTEHLQ